MTLLARIKVHTQQICGLAWSLDGEHFATGGNDNLCCLFNAEQVLESTAEAEEAQVEVFPMADLRATNLMSLGKHLPVVSPTTLSGVTTRITSPRISRIFSNTSMESGSTVNWDNRSRASSILPEQSYSSELPAPSSYDPEYLPLNYPPSPPVAPVKTWRASAALQT